MLVRLSIRNIVLIEKLDLEFGPGLTVLTGETGAGKSILLDSVSLVMGARADRALVRNGAEQGRVVAEFTVPRDHGACHYLAGEGLEHGDGHLILRRQVGSDGRSRAFINDEPVSQTMLARLGDYLVELHGQNAERGLLDPKGHRALLDRFGGYGPLLENVRTAYDQVRNTAQTLEQLEADLELARRDEEYLTHAAEELRSLNVQAGEEEELSSTRTRMMQGEKLAEDMGSFDASLSGEHGASAQIYSILRHMARLDGDVQERLTPVAEALERASLELDEAAKSLEEIARELDFDPQVLEQTEERLFEIRRLARKHNVTGDDLVVLRGQIEEKLGLLNSNDQAVAETRQALAVAKENYERAAAKLTKARLKAAKELDAGVVGELAPLKLEKAVFRTVVKHLEGDAGVGPQGRDQAHFEVKTNPSTPFGPLTKIASGGEMARFVLALKVVLARDSSVPVMVFDEVDQGIGGATADAVGERLSALAGKAQVLVVTHSPQVAARGSHHMRISKAEKAGTTHTDVGQLVDGDRLEELARMLSGAEITSEARAAAKRLLVQ